MSEFDEAAARKHFGMNSDCIDTSNDLECFVEGARWQHTQDQSALQALQSELAECRVARADMANQIALYNRDSDDRHNEMALLHKEVARLEAEVERLRALLHSFDIVCGNEDLRKLLGEAAEAKKRIWATDIELEESRNYAQIVTNEIKEVGRDRDKLKALLAEAAEALEFIRGALLTMKCDCTLIDGHREACPLCQADSTAHAAHTKLTAALGGLGHD